MQCILFPDLDVSWVLKNFIYKNGKMVLEKKKNFLLSLLSFFSFFFLFSFLEKKQVHILKYTELSMI